MMTCCKQFAFQLFNTINKTGLVRTWFSGLTTSTYSWGSTTESYVFVAHRVVTASERCSKRLYTQNSP